MKYRFTITLKNLDDGFDANAFLYEIEQLIEESEQTYYLGRENSQILMEDEYCIGINDKRKCDNGKSINWPIQTRQD